MTPPDQQPRRRLVIVDKRAPELCHVCGRVLVRGTEGVRLESRAIVHLGCADALSGPRGA